MIDRCERAGSNSYSNYGGRGISVCGRWRKSFACFLSDMGERPAGMSLDRINNDGDYEPGNCRWATVREQAQNKRSNVMVSVGGVTRCLAEWARETGISYGRLHAAYTRRHDAPAAWIDAVLKARREKAAA